MFCTAEGCHQQYLSGSKNPDGYCGLGGTGVKLSTPFATNRGGVLPDGGRPRAEP
jgi:peptide-methionine (S)-S-oxide reductase